MSPGLPDANARQVLAALRRAGFVVNRVVGSHHVLTHPTDPARTVTVPFHGARPQTRHIAQHHPASTLDRG
jgi:predicted RNA binding protein YcfA (HicA-like mRNA interferase family)